MERGCNLGSVIYPDETGQFNVPFNPDVERFAKTNPISLRFYDEDPNCGIRTNNIQSTGQRCIVGNIYGSSVVTYQQSSINCSIDGLVLVLMGVTIITVIKKFRLL